MSHSFVVPAEPVEVEEIIKRSRFLTVIERVQNGAEARALQARLKAVHPEASHHCLAFVAGPPGCTRDIGASDDGEPAGSAGRPMLNVLLGCEVGQLAAVCVRYYGGTKLGVGGLVRAYAGGVKLALESLKSIPFVPMVSVEVRGDYGDLPLVEYLVAQHRGEVLAQHFDAGVRLELALPQSALSAFEGDLRQRSAGRLEVDKPSQG
ncbi:YigZ family protein [Ferrimonas balearica]|uniref:YigZ family protein n=1 Tax=Ferrimonas balearica TaxID=44012 RepID=UPI001C99D4D6|nr:YigZ family protein [Ferrimonas balearica]MBY5923484.1 YigZ family protein [Ferrimonas balearica]MBY5997863.1 YigZ family protein [Ferrimonas balearica]